MLQLLSAALNAQALGWILIGWQCLYHYQVEKIVLKVVLYIVIVEVCFRTICLTMSIVIFIVIILCVRTGLSAIK